MLLLNTVGNAGKMAQKLSSHASVGWRTLHVRQAIVSHCEEEASGQRPLHAFQKLCLTDKLRTKIFLMHDWNDMSMAFQD